MAGRSQQRNGGRILGRESPGILAGRGLGEEGVLSQIPAARRASGTVTRGGVVCVMCRHPLGQ